MMIIKVTAQLQRLVSSHTAVAANSTPPPQVLKIQQLTDFLNPSFVLYKKTQLEGVYHEYKSDTNISISN